jgi:hypothetical protein
VLLRRCLLIFRARARARHRNRAGLARDALTRRCVLFGLVWLLVGRAAMAASVSTLLPIAGRLQWDNNNGYCGECSIQTCALYYGTYISQYQCRAIIDPTQKQDLWIDVHGKTVLDALRLNFEAWNSSQATPQYQNYLVWIKNHLHGGHPVIITLYVSEEDDPDYDHIVPAVGFQSSDDWTAYHAGDQLTFFDNYDSAAYVRAFSTLYDTRAMNNNGAVYEYCIPEDVDYGTAVTGIRDDDAVTRPVRLSVNRWDEPNVSQGQSPVTLTATVTIGSLVPNKSYCLLRYDNYQNVPTKNFPSSAFSVKQTFTASADTKTFTDHFASNGLAIYRCVALPRTAVKPGLWAHYR